MLCFSTWRPCWNSSFVKPRRNLDRPKKTFRAAGCGLVVGHKLCRFDSRLMPLRRNMADASVDVYGIQVSEDGELFNKEDNTYESKRKDKTLPRHASEASPGFRQPVNSLALAMAICQTSLQHAIHVMAKGEYIQKQRYLIACNGRTGRGCFSRRGHKRRCLNF